MSTEPARKAQRLAVLVRRVLGQSATTASAQVITGLTYIIAARQAGPSGLGVQAVCIAVATIAVVLFDFGMVNYVVRESAAGNISFSAFSKLIACKRVYVIVPTALTSAVTFSVFSSATVAVVSGTIMWWMWEAQSHNGLVRALDQYRLSAVAQVSGRIAGLVAVVVFARGASGIGLLLAMSVSWLVDALLERLFVKLKLHSTDESIRSFVPLLYDVQRKSVPFGTTSLANVAQQLDVPAVALAGGPYVAGLYAAASRLMGPLGVLASGLTSVSAPWLARSRQNRDSNVLNEKYVIRLTWVLAPLPLLTIALVPSIIPLILGRQFNASSNIFIVLTVGVALSTFGLSLAVLLQNRGFERVVASVSGSSVVLGLFLTYMLTVAGGAPFAPWGYLLAQLALASILAWVYFRRRRIVVSQRVTKDL